MRVVYFIDYIYAPGGMERMLVNKANALVGRGVDVSVIACAPPDKQPFFLLDERVKIYDTGVEYDSLKDKSGLSAALAYGRLNRLHRRKAEEFLFAIRPDIAVSMHKGERRFLPYIKDGSKKVLEIHYDKRAAVSGHNRFRPSNMLRPARFLRALFSGKSFAEVTELRLIAAYDRFVVLTNEDRAQWGDLPNIEAIPNFIDCRAGVSTCEAKRAIAVGRLNPVKGFDMLIDMWSRVERGDWRLDIFGDGELRGELNEMIAAKDVSDGVTIHRPTSAIMERYAESSLFLLTSRMEGFPMVLLESMASGLPAVSFACKCGPRDMIEDGTSGILVDVGDVEAMASAVSALIADDGCRRAMGQKALERSALFSKDVVVDRWIELFKSLKNE